MDFKLGADLDNFDRIDAFIGKLKNKSKLVGKRVQPIVNTTKIAYKTVDVKKLAATTTNLL